MEQLFKMRKLDKQTTSYLNKVDTAVKNLLSAC